MKFLNRHAELKRLNSLLSQKQGNLAVIYGRRRIGKSRLLLEWIKKTDGIYTVADQSNAAVQRMYFAHSVAARFPGFNEVDYKDFRSLLERLSREAIISGWHGPLVIDELPYLVSSDPALPSILQNWLDIHAKKAGIVVAIAGSSQRMMQGIVLNAHAPLYGRASEIIKLNPLFPKYLSRVLISLTFRETVEYFSVLGGIPRYWELVIPFGNNIKQAVDKIILDPTGPLHEEADRILLDETPPMISLRPVLDLIGAGAHRLSEIAGRMQQPATSMSRPLSKLIEMGLVKREIPFSEPVRRTKRSLYKIADPFFRFWFTVIAPNKAYLARCLPKARVSIWEKYRNNLESSMWEELCRDALPFLDGNNSALGVFGPWEPGGRFWRGNSPEWDIVSYSLDGKYALLGEAKWPENPASIKTINNWAKELLDKGVPPIKGMEKRKLVWALFLPEIPSGAGQSGLEEVILIDAQTVLKYLG